MTDRFNEIVRLVSDKYIITIKENDWKYSHMIEHEDGTYKCVDWGDRDNPIKIDTKTALTDDKCKFILKCQLRPGSPDKLRPFFFFAKGGTKFSPQVEDLRTCKKVRNKVYWRGNAHAHRESNLHELSSILNHDYMDKRNKNVYYREMAQSKMALSLPGLGPSCHREFEAFAVRTPVIMPEFKNLYYENIIPNYHYISVEQKYGESMSEAILRRYQEVKDDQDLLDYVVHNAMQYYDKYCRFDVSVQWMIKMLEL